MHQYRRTLDAESPSLPELTDFESRIVRNLIEVIAPLQCAWKERVLIALEDGIEINLAAHTLGSSRIHLYISRDNEVGFAAGDGVYFNVPSDVELPEKTELDAYAMRIVEAMLKGKLTETVYSRGSTSYKWSFTLDVSGRTITLERTDLGKLLCSFWRSKRRRMISYAPYEPE